MEKFIVANIAKKLNIKEYHSALELFRTKYHFYSTIESVQAALFICKASPVELKAHFKI
tara:strand:- start:1259 stop:1435 length:177 start_codon:yes stop_codon:yes gene_type:complete